jgi:hypothetical protein
MVVWADAAFAKPELDEALEARGEHTRSASPPTRRWNRPSLRCLMRGIEVIL